MKKMNGYQMSGINDEDFVNSNFSPLYNINVGKWLNKTLGIQVGYKGYYFKYIMDSYRHYYYFYFIEALIDLNEITKFDKKFGHCIFNIGTGYFHNISYKKSNICINSGLMNQINFNRNISLLFSISSISGWDIYQGNGIFSRALVLD